MKLTFIRHTSVDVLKGTCYGQTDVPLRDTFLQEAAEVSSRLRGQTFDKVYTSPLSRCTRLADQCGFKEAERDKRLLELDFGNWEMQRFDDIKDPHLQVWYDDFLHVRASGGESFDDLRCRVSSFLNELCLKPYRHVAIFTHGGVIICAQLHAGLLREEEAFQSLTPYGGCVTLQIPAKLQI